LSKDDIKKRRKYLSNLVNDLVVFFGVENIRQPGERICVRVCIDDSTAHVRTWIRPRPCRKNAKPDNQPLSAEDRSIILDMLWPKRSRPFVRKGLGLDLDGADFLGKHISAKVFKSINDMFRGRKLNYRMVYMSKNGKIPQLDSVVKIVHASF
jgi:hypothetical protein